MARMACARASVSAFVHTGQPLCLTLQVAGVRLKDRAEVRQHAFGEGEHDARETFLHHESGRRAVSWRQNKDAHASENASDTTAPRHASRWHDTGHLRSERAIC